MRKICIACFSALGEALGQSLEMGEVTRFPGEASLQEWTKDRFDSADALVFIGACGIAVRAIAPFVKSKLTDPAVVVVDESGTYVIPLLSGHTGGANDLARRIAGQLQAHLAVTTATDRRGTFAADSWARENGFGIVNPEAVKAISAAVLDGDEIVLGIHRKGEERKPSGDRVQIVQPLRLVPRTVVIGAGCRRGISPEHLESCFQDFCRRHEIEPASISCLASIDLKKEEPALKKLARKHRVPFLTYSAGQLMELEGDFTLSEFVMEQTGADNVCERAAVRALFDLDPNGVEKKYFRQNASDHLTLRKEAFEGVTFAAARASTPGCWEWCGISGHKTGQTDAPCSPVQQSKVSERQTITKEKKTGTLYLVGMGPGGMQDMTYRAVEAVRLCTVLCGYAHYVDLLLEQMPETAGKRILTTPMRREMERCYLAMEEASRGESVAMVCSGDAGIYGMAGPVLQMEQDFLNVAVEIIPGITAAVSGAALLGAPLMNDFCLISLSDLLIPWEVIERRIRSAAEGDFTAVIYNPMSTKRTWQLGRACEIFLEYRSGDTACGWVRNIGRRGQEKKILTLEQLSSEKVDMFTTIYIGSSTMLRSGDHLITQRGYPSSQEGFRFDETAIAGQPV